MRRKVMAVLLALGLVTLFLWGIGLEIVLDAPAEPNPTENAPNPLGQAETERAKRLAVPPDSGEDVTGVPLPATAAAGR